MPPTLLLIRHAQALHNIASEWDIHDPPLSDLGEQQCKELHQSLKNSKIGNEVELIVVSAMRRTLQTASIGLEWLIKEKGINVLPHAGWQGKCYMLALYLHDQLPKHLSDLIKCLISIIRHCPIEMNRHAGRSFHVEIVSSFSMPLTASLPENADKPCDTGSPISVMEKEFPDYDFSSVDPLYPDKTTNLRNNPYAFTGKALLARGQTCLKELYSRPEKVIAVVSHSGFMRVAVANRRFFNADWRVFEYDEERMKESKDRGEGAGGQGTFFLKEWEETESKGGAMGRSEKGVFGAMPDDYPTGDELLEELKNKTKEEPTKEIPGQ
jgi:broad specificity phosphatase PhoE